MNITLARLKMESLYGQSGKSLVFVFLYVKILIYFANSSQTFTQMSSSSTTGIHFLLIDK